MICLHGYMPSEKNVSFISSKFRASLSDIVICVSHLPFPQSWSGLLWQKIANWFRANKIAINVTKTKFIVFRTRGKPVHPQDCQLIYNGNEIGVPVNQDLIHPVERIHKEGETKNFKLLGVLFDECLSFDDHINGICAKISKSLFCINRIKNFVNQDTLKTLYFAMVHFNLVYCSNIYSCSNTTSLNKLRVKQKQTVRTICNAGIRDHTAPLFAQLRILPLDHLI
jgi:hypothetical protein